MRRLAAVVAITLLATLGACSGSDSSSGGSGSDGTATAPGSDKAVEVLDPCKILSVGQIGPVLGGNATLKEAPGGGCSFDQEDDPRAPSVGFFAIPGADGGGFESTKAGLTVDGKIVDVAGVGDGAWLAVGKAGGDNLQGQGVVSVGGTIVNIALTQGNGLDEAKVKSMMESLISLVGTIG